jgi:hypothetical protein
MTQQAKSDRELLEAAAKAEGTVYTDPAIECVHRGGPVFLRPEGGLNFQWNPLDNDADAFRLAVKLGLEIGSSAFTSIHVGRGNACFAAENTQPDPYAATRRAIVRAAADLSRAGEA